LIDVAPSEGVFTKRTECTPYSKR